MLGDNAGPSKLNAIRKHGLTALSEDDFLDFIGTRVGPGGPGGAALDDKTRKKMEKDAEGIKAAAKVLESREKQDAKARRAKAGGCVFCVSLGAFLLMALRSAGAQPDLGSQLWTTRYAPRTLKEVCGNKSQVEKWQQWLHDWSVPSSFPSPHRRLTLRWQAVELEIRLQEAREERDEHLSRRPHIRFAWHRQDDERTLVCEIRGVYPDRA